MLELAFSWLAGAPASLQRHRRRPPASKQVEQNVKAIGWTLSAEEMAEIDGITK